MTTTPLHTPRKFQLQTLFCYLKQQFFFIICSYKSCLILMSACVTNGHPTYSTNYPLCFIINCLRALQISRSTCALSREYSSCRRRIFWSLSAYSIFICFFFLHTNAHQQFAPQCLPCTGSSLTIS